MCKKIRPHLGRGNQTENNFRFESSVVLEKWVVLRRLVGAKLKASRGIQSLVWHRFYCGFVNYNFPQQMVFC